MKELDTNKGVGRSERVGGTPDATHVADIAVFS